jgi:hypothetical protein
MNLIGVDWHTYYIPIHPDIQRPDQDKTEGHRLTVVLDRSVATSCPCTLNRHSHGIGGRMNLNYRRYPWEQRLRQADPGNNT